MEADPSSSLFFLSSSCLLAPILDEGFASVLPSAAQPPSRQSKPTAKLGRHPSHFRPLCDLTGPGSEMAAKMAAEISAAT